MPGVRNAGRYVRVRAPDAGARRHSVSLLGQKLTVGAQFPNPVEDAEALSRSVADARLRQWGAHLNRDQYEALVSFLIGQCWELEGRYDEAKDKKPNFASYAARILSLRVADWYRQEFGDTRHGERPIVLSLDAPATLEGGDSEEYGGRLVDTLASSAGDPAEDRSLDLVGVLERGDRGADGQDNALGEPADRGAARGNRSAAGLKKGRIPAAKTRSGQPATCEQCYLVFLSAFRKVNAKLAEGKQETDGQLEERARRRAQAVRIGPVWACPRCTSFEDERGKELLFSEAYPNRAARRAAGGKTRKRGALKRAMSESQKRQRKGAT